MWSEKRFLAVLGLAVGLVAGILILALSGGRDGLELLQLAAGIAIIYGSYLIYRGKTSLLFGWGKTRLGAMINLGLGLLTLLVPGGISGTASILAIVSGVLGFLAA